MSGSGSESPPRYTATEKGKGKDSATNVTSTRRRPRPLPRYANHDSSAIQDVDTNLFSSIATSFIHPPSFSLSNATGTTPDPATRPSQSVSSSKSQPKPASGIHPNGFSPTSSVPHLHRSQHSTSNPKNHRVTKKLLQSVKPLTSECPPFVFFLLLLHLLYASLFLEIRLSKP